MGGNFPNAEEDQDMVDAVGGESTLPFCGNASATIGSRLFPLPPNCMWGSPSFVRSWRMRRAVRRLVRSC